MVEGFRKSLFSQKYLGMCYYFMTMTSTPDRPVKIKLIVFVSQQVLTLMQTQLGPTAVNNTGITGQWS